jgi:hypothetical protein
MEYALPFLLFPVMFAAIWFGVTFLLGWMSGWHSLMERYPDRHETPLLQLSWQTGVMGTAGVNYKNILRLAACPSGLRVGVMKLFGPFARDFMVPWRDIEVKRQRWFWMGRALVPRSRQTYGRGLHRRPACIGGRQALAGGAQAALRSSPAGRVAGPALPSRGRKPRLFSPRRCVRVTLLEGGAVSLAGSRAGLGGSMRRWVALTLSAAMWAAWPAQAAAPKADFDGAFLGLQTEYAFGASGDWCGCSFVTPATATAGGEGGIIAGAQAGYDWRFGAFVVEIGARVSYADLGFDRVCAGTARCDGALDWLAEAQVSAGFVVFGDLLIAGTAGLAAGDVTATAGGALESTATNDGHVLAVRGEQAMSGGWRFGLEYRYYEMDGTNRLDTPTSAAADVDVTWTAHVVGLTIANEF